MKMVSERETAGHNAVHILNLLFVPVRLSIFWTVACSSVWAMRPKQMTPFCFVYYCREFLFFINVFSLINVPINVQTHNVCIFVIKICIYCDSFVDCSYVMLRGISPLWLFLRFLAFFPRFFIGGVFTYSYLGLRTVGVMHRL